jgi:hypothetical protein
MNHANEQARSGPPLPPPTKLSLELARLVCGNTQQKASAAERLEPVFREVDLHTPHEAEPAIKDKPEPLPRDGPRKRPTMISLRPRRWPSTLPWMRSSSNR